jgi:hypothetical protein
MCFKIERFYVVCQNLNHKTQYHVTNLRYAGEQYATQMGAEWRPYFNSELLHRIMLLNVS